MKKLVLILFVTFFLILIFQVVSLAQIFPPEPEPIPFDGGLIALLLAIAGFFGGKKVFNKYKKKQ